MKYSVLSSVSTVVFYQLLIEYWTFFQFSWRQFQKFFLSCTPFFFFHEASVTWPGFELPQLSRIFHSKHVSNSQKHYSKKSPSNTGSTDFGIVLSVSKYTIFNTLTSMLLISSKYLRSRTLVNAYWKEKKKERTKVINLKSHKNQQNIVTHKSSCLCANTTDRNMLGLVFV